MGEYKVEMDDDIIRAILSGVYLKRDLDAIMAQISNLAHETGKNNIFLDIGGIEEISGGARRALAQQIAIEPRFFNKLAIYGANAKHRVMADFIITASGKGNNVRYFENEEEAMRWLKE